LTTPRNPYRNSKSGISTPSASVKNPYRKQSPFSSAKHTLDFSAKGTPPRKRNIASPRTSTAGGKQTCQSTAINLSEECFATAITTDPHKTYTLYFDGGSRGNPGIAGAGIVLYDGTEEIWHGKTYLGDDATNNEAEYLALAAGLDCVRRLGVE
jgi:hypothetical protein